MQREQRTSLLCDTMRLVVSSLVDDQSAIQVIPLQTEGAGTSVEVFVAKGDLGKLVGKSGRMAKALREYVRAYEQQHGGTYHLVVRDIAD